MKKITQIVNRIKIHKQIQDDKEAATLLGMNDTALSNHKTRDTIPFKPLYDFALQEGLSFEWLINGKGEKHIIESGQGTLDSKENEIINKVLFVIRHVWEDNQHDSLLQNIDTFYKTAYREYERTGGLIKNDNRASPPSPKKNHNQE